jgi:putative transposase
MPRKARQLADNGVYHLISRGNNQLSILAIEGGFTYFKELLRRSKEKYPWRIYHYCLMSNHVHILAEINQGSDLPLIMRDVLLGYSRWYRFQTSYVGHVWQARYRNSMINRESYLLECGRYIERNPVRAGICRLPEEYQWSSYRHYVCGEPDPLVETDPSFENFGFSDVERRAKYRSFVKLPAPF